ncbi:hypothetical protein [Micromonospora sp. NPDC002717]|uniref:hypothetical protein n=1 Tax=Micromonospora sp. NPDC002717 TaxID=3154424 RepID=UPI00331BABAF
MGSRANVAVRLNGEWTHCGSNGMGYSLDAWLALGPAPALAVIESFAVWDRDEWQIESSCEAGALIDLDGQDLLFFLDADYDQRLADLDGYRRTWPGWTIRWAYNGIADITDALDLDRAVLRRKPWDNTDLFQWGHPDAQEPPDLRYLVTVGDAGYGLSGWAVPPWQVGPDLLDQLTGLPQPSTWPEVPRGGLHLDPAARRAGVWSVDPVLGLADRFAECWPGWTLEFWQDRYQEQERRCAGAFRFPDPAPAVDLCGYALLRRVMQHWVRATAEFRDSWPQEQEDYDPFYGTRNARLSVADLQRLGELLLGPDRDPHHPPAIPHGWPAFWTEWATTGDWSRPLDVAAYARQLHGH